MLRPFALLLLVVATGVAQAQFNIYNSPGLFDPSFRGQPNTTWYGWGPGGFEGATQNELIDNPAPTFGTTTTGMSFNQNPATDILSSTDNIYTAAAGAVDLLFEIPTSGTVGSGFTTVIVQGRTAFGGFDVPPSLSPISGFSPDYLAGPNASGAGQFWAKYQIPGNLAVYNLTMTLADASFTSIAELEFDTYSSLTGYAPDSALVPEPSTWALLGVGLAACVLVRKRFQGK